MPSLISEMWQTLQAALGARRYIVGHTAGGAAGVLVTIAGAFGASAYFSQWLVFVAVLLLLVLWWVLSYANALRIAAAPRLLIESVRITETWGTPTNPFLPPQKIKEQRRSNWIKLRVVNTGTKVAKGCRPYLLGIEQASPNGQEWLPTAYDDVLYLKWSNREEGEKLRPADIKKGVGDDFELLWTDERWNKIFMQWNVKLNRYTNLFLDSGRYRFRVKVSGENAESQPVSVVVTDNGKWNEIEAEIE